jgi:hypothetical protein
MRKKIFISAEVDRTLEREARLAAALLGISRSEIIRRGVVGYLSNLDLPKIDRYQEAKQCTDSKTN